MAYVCYMPIKDLSNTDKQQLKACKIILKSVSQGGAGVANKPLWRKYWRAGAAGRLASR